MTAQQAAIRQWATRPENRYNPNTAYGDLNAAEKAEVDAIVAENKRRQDQANRKGNGGINISIPISNINIGLNLTIPCPRLGNVIPNPAPVPRSIPTPDLPGTNNTSTNGGTNRVPGNTNSNPIIRTYPSNVNTNRGSTNRGTNGNGRGVSLRPGFTD